MAINLKREFEQLVSKEIDELGDKVIDDVKPRSRYRTGKMRSLTRLNDTPTGFEIVSDADYSEYVSNRYGWTRSGMTLEEAVEQSIERNLPGN